MATKFFKHVDARECEAARDAGKVALCNLTGHKIEVDEEGRFLTPRGHAVIDKVNPLITSLVAKGLIAVNEGVKADPKPSRSKKKEEQPGFNPDAKDGDGDGLVQDGTVHERPVAEPAVEEVAPEVAEVSSEAEEV